MFIYVKCFVYVFYSAHLNPLRETLSLSRVSDEEIEAWKGYSFSKITVSKWQGLDLNWFLCLTIFSCCKNNCCYPDQKTNNVPQT